MELFLRSSLVAYWTPINLGGEGGVSFPVSYLFTLSLFLWGPQCKNTEVVCHSFLQGTTLCLALPFSHSISSTQVHFCLYFYCVRRLALGNTATIYVRMFCLISKSFIDPVLFQVFRGCSEFSLHETVQFTQNHLLKRLFSMFVFFPSLLQINFDHKCMGLFLFCSICLFFLLQLCSIVCIPRKLGIQLFSFSSGLLWQFQVFCDSI